MSLRNAKLVNWGLKHQPSDNPPGIEAHGTERGNPESVLIATENKEVEHEQVADAKSKSSDKNQRAGDHRIIGRISRSSPH